MKLINFQFIIIFTGLILSVTSFFMIGDYMQKINQQKKSIIVLNQDNKKSINEFQTSNIATIENTTIEKITSEKKITEETTTKKIISTTKVIPTTKDEVIFDGLTENDLTIKLNKNLNNVLDNMGLYFSAYTKKTGLDPYLAVAIILQETGCKWKCSSIATNCNNVGGIKGTPSCNGGSYKRYETIEEGINSYLDMIYNNYYLKGLNTPELMNPKYASSNEWSIAVNKYINTIRES
ncbi:MAG: glucosaminidase domain-containing protein [Bacilli bacterium]|nr:glucosaminidase domain-containing protein [Bacilli bacterium]